jgi:hypothetical protein
MQLADVLAKSLKWRQEKEESLDKDPDRLFLSSLLEDFKKVPINKKATVKIAIIKAIDDGRIEHPYRSPYEPINYPPPTPVQKNLFITELMIIMVFPLVHHLLLKTGVVMYIIHP